MIQYSSAHRMHLLPQSDTVKFNLCSFKHFTCQNIILARIVLTCLHDMANSFQQAIYCENAEKLPYFVWDSI